MQDNLLERLWQTVKAEQPMVHVLSNIVTANDCANLLLAVGARPIMAQGAAGGGGNYGRLQWNCVEFRHSG